jgi:F-type H+-transporting ATPase subunit epsilon
MQVEIITPEKKLFAGESSMVRVPGSKGSFQMLTSHAPIVSTLEKGLITVRKNDGDEITFEINSGLVECKKDKIVILVEI